MSQSRRRRAKNPPASGPSGATAWLSSPTANPAALNNFSFILGSQIRYLVNNLSKKNYKSTVSELDHIITLYGHDAYLYLLRCLVEQIDVKDYKIQKDHPKIQLLHQQTLELSKQPNFASVVLQAMAGMEFREDFLTRFCKHLKLPLAQEVLLALGAAQASEAGVLQEGKRFLRSKISEVAQHPSALPPEVLYELLFFVRTKDGFSKHRTNLLRALQKQGPSYIKSLPSTLALLITETEVDMTSDQSFDRNLMTGAFEEQQSLVSAITAACHPSELMEDLGYSCCQARSPGSFKEFLRQFPAITEREVAQMISLMVRTRTGLGEGKEPTSPTSSTNEKDRPQTWNTGVFVSTIKEMFPNLDWPLVIRNLDLPDFEVEDTKALAMVLSIYKKATKLPFPHKALYGSWANPKGQLSFLKLAIFAPPDVINFGDGHEEILTQMPHPNQNASALIHNWTSLPLIETLLHLAAVDDYAEVRGIFDYPIEHCPELLLLKLAQVTPTWGALHSELCSILLPMFVHRHPHKHPNSNFVLSKLWAYNRALFIRAVVDLHSGDSSSIVQSVLGLSQELKIFPEILQVPKFPFVIELAVLAREKGFNLNLGQWAQERIAEYKLDFVRPCFEFLRNMASREDAPGQGLSSEIAAALLTALKNSFPALPPDLVDEYDHLKSTYGVPSSTPQGSALSLHSPESAPPPIAADTSGSAFPATAAPDKEVFPPDIEGPANAYFQSVYTGQMSIDEVVQLLKNFKSSANKREQRIFQCMIHNLFDEYRFFQKYPDKELQITGVLFGQLIQHQLVSYISLGIALRYVLEALKKPPNSKMLKFGMYALTQFKARLVEWPQYCHHILQIPHMQRCSPEVIQFIENAIRTSDT
ncbi:CCR4-NOT core subunit cdc39, partial [Balamuthia mandrillaris]